MPAIQYKGVSPAPIWRNLYFDRTVRMEFFARTTIRRSSLASLDQHSAAVTSDLQFFLCGNNLDFVCGKAKELEAVSG